MISHIVHTHTKTTLSHIDKIIEFVLKREGSNDYIKHGRNPLS